MLAVLVAVLWLASYVLPLPLDSMQEIMRFAGRVYGRYGYWVVFLGSLIEGLVLANFYFPGSTMVILAAVFARQGLLSLPWVIVLAVCGFGLAFNLNYLLGRYGWQRLLSRLGLAGALRRAEDKLRQMRWRGLFLGLVSPQLGVLVTTSAGVLRLPYRTFLAVMLLGLGFWTVIWALLAFWLGGYVVRLLTHYGWLWVVPFALWLGWEVWRAWRAPDAPQRQGEP